MSKNRGRRLGFWAVLSSLAFPAACGSSGVVGGRCAASHIDCNGRCVDAQNDPNNCGGCGRKCKPGVSCEDALCDGVPAGGGASGGGASGDGGSSADSGAGGSSAAAGEEDDAGNLSDANPDGDAGCLPPYNTSAKCGDCQTKCSAAKPNCAPYGKDEYVCVATCQSPLVECDGQCVESTFTTPEACGGCNVHCSGAKPLCSPNGDGLYICKALCEAPLVPCNGQCVEPTFDTPEGCGACNAACPAAQPTCSPDTAGNYKCVLDCEDPLKACNGRCVDFNIDAENCGFCGNVCQSGICQGGKCVGADDGDIVVVGMNFQTAVSNSAANRLLGNAVLLPGPQQVRILAYTEFASATSRARVDQHITFAAAAVGRSVVITPLTKYTSASAALNIANYDEFLIYEQDLAPAGELGVVGAAWQTNSLLESFTAAGGVIVALSGGSFEMDQFFTNAQLLDVSAQNVVTGSFLYNRASGDSVGNNVISPFSAPSDSCTFTTSATPGPRTVFVITDSMSDPALPVVVHRNVPKPP
jgi:stigma-specific protein Stig1